MPNRFDSILAGEDRLTDWEPGKRFEQAAPVNRFARQPMIPDPPPPPPPEPDPGFLDYAGAFAHGVSLIPGEALSTAIGAFQGREGAAAPDPFDEFIKGQIRRTNNYNRKVAERIGTGVDAEGFRALPQIGYTAATIPTYMAGAALGGAGGSLVSPGVGTVAGVAGGIAATQQLVQRSTEFRTALDMLEVENENRASKGIKEMDAQEALEFIDRYEDQQVEVGRWNSYSEALSTVIQLALFKRVLGGKGLASILKRGGQAVAGTAGLEMPTEVITGIGETQALQGTNLAPEERSFKSWRDIVQTAREVAPAVGVTSLAVGGTGAAYTSFANRRGENRAIRTAELDPKKDRNLYRARQMELLELKQKQPDFDLGGVEAKNFLRTGHYDGQVPKQEAPEQAPAGQTDTQAPQRTTRPFFFALNENGAVTPEAILDNTPETLANLPNEAYARADKETIVEAVRRTAEGLGVEVKDSEVKTKGGAVKKLKELARTAAPTDGRQGNLFEEQAQAPQEQAQEPVTPEQMELDLQAAPAPITPPAQPPVEPIDDGGQINLFADPKQVQIALRDETNQQFTGAEQQSLFDVPDSRDPGVLGRSLPQAPVEVLSVTPNEEFDKRPLQELKDTLASLQAQLDPAGKAFEDMVKVKSKADAAAKIKEFAKELQETGPRTRAQSPTEETHIKEPWQMTQEAFTAPVEENKLPHEVFYVGETEVIQNPTAQDYQQLTKETRERFPNNTDPETRFTEDAEGNRFIWKSSDAVHEQIEPEISRRLGRAVSQNPERNDRATHRRSVYEALQRGDSVPDNVLADYKNDEVISALIKPAPPKFRAASPKSVVKQAVAQAGTPVSKEAQGLATDLLPKNVDNVQEAVTQARAKLLEGYSDDGSTISPTNVFALEADALLRKMAEPGSTYSVETPPLTQLEALPESGGANVREAVVSKEWAALAENISKLTGRAIKFFTSDKRLPYSGVVLPSDPNTLYVSAESGQLSHSFLVGHELWHTMEAELKTTEAGRKLLKEMHKQINSMARDTRSNMIKSAVGPREVDGRVAGEELRSEVFATFFQHPDFMAKALAAADMSPRSTLSIWEKVVEFIDNLIISGTQYAPLIKEMTATRDNLALQFGRHILQKDPNYQTKVDEAKFRMKEQITVDGVSRPTRDSNGRALHHTEEGIKNFWKWFGDSTVVDDKGRPIVVYHGTKHSFNTFDPNQIGSENDSGWYGKGFYFTAEPKIANSYIGYAFGEGPMHNWAGYGQNIMPVYLKITKSVLWGKDDQAATTPEESEQFTQVMKAAGHDGVRVDYTDFDGEVTPSAELVVFDNTQIKSATGNYGSFGESQDVRFRASDIGWTPERVSREIRRADYPDGRTKAVVAFVSPAAFIRATTKSEAGRRSIYEESGDLDLDKLRENDQAPFVYVEYVPRHDDASKEVWAGMKERGFDYVPSDLDVVDFKIVGHEGRHRLAAMDKAGITKVPIVIDYRKVEKRERSEKTELMKNQFSTFGDALRGSEVIPLTRENEAIINEAMPKDAQFRANPAFHFDSPASVVAGIDHKMQEGMKLAKKIGKELTTAKGQKAWSAEAISKAIAWLPMGNLVEMHGRSRKWLQDYYDLFTKDMRERQHWLERVQPMMTQFNGKLRKHLMATNKAAITNSLVQMNPWNTIDKQAWVPKEIRNNPKISVNEKIAAAEEAWLRNEMDKKTGYSYRKAYEAGQIDYKAIGNKQAQLEYKKISELMRRMHREQRQVTEDRIKEVAAGDVETARVLARVLLPDGETRGAYWPLTREGRYGLSIKRKGSTDIKDQRFEMFESAAAARAELLAAQEADVHNEYDIKAFDKGLDEFNRQPIPREFVQQLTGEMQERLTRLGVKQSEIDSLVSYAVQAHLRSQPEMSALKNSMKRKGIAGANEERAMSAAASYIAKNANRLAQAKFGRKMEEMLNAQHDIANEEAQAKGELIDPIDRAIIDSLQARANATKTADTNVVTRTATKMASMWYMFSPSAYLVQASQPWATTLPRLLVEYGPESMKHLSSAYRDALFNKDFTMSNLAMEPEDAPADIGVALRLYRDIKSYENRQQNEETDVARAAGVSIKQRMAQLTKTQEEILAMKFAVDKGVMNAVMVNEVLDQGRNDNSTGIHQSMLFFMRKGEEHSRIAAFLAGFRAAKAKGRNFDTATSEAAEIADSTLFQYAKEAKPVLLQNAWIRTATQFQYFSYSLAARTYVLSMKTLRNIKPKNEAERAERNKAMSELTYLMGTTTVLGGALGGVPTALGIAVIQFFLDNDDEPRDMRAEITEELEKMPGGAMLARGLFAGLGADVSQRIGVADTYGLGNSGPAGIHGGSAVDMMLTSAAGPFYSLVRDAAKGYDLMTREGRWLDGSIAMMPKAVKDFLKSTKLATKGAQLGDQTTVIQPENTTIVDIALQLVGVAPVKINQALGREYAIKNLSTRITERRTELVRKVSQALETGDPDRVDAALDDVMAFNKRMPEFALQKTDFTRAATIMMKKKAGIPDNRNIVVRSRYGFAGRE